jgi:hypothetical protein
MKTIKVSIAIYSILVIAAITSTILFQIDHPKNIDFWFIKDCISMSVTVIGLISVVFSKWLWKFKFFSGWLVLVPDLNGIWRGTIRSTWKGNVDPIATSLSIKQSLFSISCVIKTKESKSQSITCDFVMDEKNQMKQLTYTYLNVPKAIYKDRSQIHYGSTILDIEDNRLTGDYWTDRKTTGRIELIIESD